MTGPPGHGGPASLETAPWRDAAVELGVDVERGLDQAEAARRVERFGTNETPEATTPATLRLLRRFVGLTPFMLELTVVLALFLRNYVDAAIIGLLLLFNAVLGFVQEDRASKAVRPSRSGSASGLACFAPAPGRSSRRGSSCRETSSGCAPATSFPRT